jgi:hypothetical protein
MIKGARFVASVAAMAAALLCATSVHAQATRTWVSGVGDDANPCSRTAPCKTFAGAISKTAASGEINVLDPGGFGAVTITKAIAISSEGFEAGVLVSGTNGMIINAGVNDDVILRGLDFEGVGTGLSGVRFLAGRSVTIEKCTINHFQIGVEIANSAGAAKVSIKDSNIRGNSTTAGVLIKPTGTGTAKAALDNVRLENNAIGLRVEDNGKASMTRSVASNNTFSGAIAFSSGVLAEINVGESMLVNNGNGIKSENANALVRIGTTTVTDNVTGLNAAGGQIISFGNNRVAGNTTNGAPTSTTPQM